MARCISDQDWQMKLPSLNERAKHVLESGQWSDCSFVVGNEGNQKTIKGHRLILAMSSPVFEAMFFGGMAEKSDKAIEILDVQPEAFGALLQYIYCSEIKLRSFDQVCEICYAAKKYMIPSLVEKCTEYIWSDLHPGNVCRAYEFARLFEEPSLLDKCLQIIQNDTVQVLREASFEEVDSGTLCTILQQDNLSVPESVVWDACLRWAKQECVRQSLEVNAANQRKVLENCLPLIRFLTLTPSEFANGPAVSGLLTQEESFTLLMNISSPGVTNVPMPFCQSRNKRLREEPVALTSSSQFSLRGMSGTGGIKENVHLRCKCVGDEVADVLINEQLVDCTLTFSVDKPVCIYGMQIPSQLCPENYDQQINYRSSRHSYSEYSELIYAFLQDSDGCRLTYTHFTARVPWNCSVEVLYNRPVYITPNKSYKIVIVLNKVGRYPMFNPVHSVVLDYITFTFGNGSAQEGLWLIKALIFGVSSQRMSISSERFWPY